MTEQTPKPNNTKLTMRIRIILGIASIPSFLLAGMLGVMIVNGDASDIGFFEAVYACVGILALYIALSGKRLF
ncbi:hypothetical protein [Glaciecola petra]|uniref:Uncharacterized protein n=1 Tax=Glaciecola petra TaxID=3075602 RepID=A0ABU2ZN06_9ALTE|nr:hypothetical protein [Aestuariibacter sp. P117]MDT0593998.1 hypothetical protein [Aestuariibacter sp. P117]